VFGNEALPPDDQLERTRRHSTERILEFIQNDCLVLRGYNIAKGSQELGSVIRNIQRLTTVLQERNEQEKPE